MERDRERQKRERERERALETIVSRLTRRAVIRRGWVTKGRTTGNCSRGWIMAETRESTIMAAPGTSLALEGSVSARSRHSLAPPNCLVSWPRLCIPSVLPAVVLYRPYEPSVATYHSADRSQLGRLLLTRSMPDRVRGNSTEISG